MDADLFMECQDEELDPCQMVDDDVDEDDWDFQDEDNHSGEEQMDSCEKPWSKEDLDSDEEWFPMREDTGSRGPPTFQTASDYQVLSDSEEETAQPTSSATLPRDGGQNRDEESRETQPTTSSTLPPVSSKKRGRKRKRNADTFPVPATDSEWNERNWKPKDIPFTANPGPLNGAAALESEDPVDFLELFLSEELLQRVVVQTNLYAEQCIQTVSDSLPESYARALVWKPVDLSELKAFLGLHFLTGIVHKSELERYWSTDEIVATPYFNKTMTLNRFQLIWRFLHFSDNANLSNRGTDRMYKIRPLLDFLVSKFREMYQPNKDICIDEGTLLFRGRLNFKVHNPQKPVKNGIKSFILCDSETGYCFNMKPDCGEHAALADTVVFLLDGLAGYGYRLFIDNFYNSVPMCARLLDLKTHVCGTLRKNRGEPPFIRHLTNADLRVGDTTVRHNDKMMVLAWRDKSIVRMVSTFHQNEMGNIQVPRGQGEKMAKPKPACIVAYNKCMNGVDKLDQNIVYYPFVGKSNKWTSKFVAYLFEICMFNAFVIYKAKNPHSNCKCLLSFMQSVIKSWTSPRHAWVEPAVEEVTNAPPPEHVLVALPPTAKKQQPSKRCRLCYQKKERKETRYYCKGCLIPLCKDECFAVFHSGQTHKRFGFDFGVGFDAGPFRGELLVESSTSPGAENGAAGHVIHVTRSVTGTDVKRPKDLA